MIKLESQVLQFPHSNRSKRNHEQHFCLFIRHDLVNFKTSWLFNLSIFGTRPWNTQSPYKLWLFWREKMGASTKGRSCRIQVSSRLHEQGTETTQEWRDKREGVEKSHITTDTADQSVIISSYFSPLHQSQPCRWEWTDNDHVWLIEIDCFY